MAEDHSVKYVVQSYTGGYGGPGYHYTWESLADALDYIEYQCLKYEKNYSYLILRFDDNTLVDVLGPLNKDNNWLGYFSLEEDNG